ncbi:hypothetical protein BD289DRAFT_361380 [Coniella lustricola]|uniref:Carrier domain-containing protein n=1 Tax=Coniella lustricola TaxID=2025994 RepID=A0A2T3AIP8_9PEZI|nr:hypothetical protein BD289DRAFT_361380 [Coniella lustricola]
MTRPTRTVRFQVNGWNDDKKTACAHDELSPTSISASCSALTANPSYFTCTLGQAARWNANRPHPFKTVNHLIDEQANELRQRPAVNFPGGCYSDDGREMKTEFTYRELRHYSLVAAARLRRRLQVASRADSSTAGLLCSSTPEFLVTWLGLMRLGMSVMVLAPQLEENAIRHLCSTKDVSVVFADGRNYDTAKHLKNGIFAINISHVLHNLRCDPSPSIVPANCQPSDLAYLFHTSGTSSGLPKPIPQTHHAAVGVLARLPGGEGHATLSTTPLYHGGISDCFRAWSGGATIHLFPGTQPITAANVCRAVDLADTYLQGAYPVKYFTAVPYVLQMLATDGSSTTDHSSPGMRLLRRMELVGVGGAALSPSLGDALVANGVNLLSRFGSAECGFLLSSHRDYANDLEWSWLRADPALQPGGYSFEPRDNQDSGPPLFEFVVGPEWPHRSKTNRPDGSFATADLFEKHPSIPNAWRYHSRADAQIALVNGKKFDPAPVESDLLASEVGSRILSDAMIFGTGREAPGLLLIPRWDGDQLSSAQVIEELWPTVAAMNAETQSHAKLAKENIAVVRVKNGETAVLPKSSKGTIMRRKAEKMFSSEIEALYNGGPTEEDSFRDEIPDSEVPSELQKLFDDVLGRHVNTSRDLFAQGVDSIACSRLRQRILKAFFPKSDTLIPLNVIYDQGSIERISSYILRLRHSNDLTVVPNGAAGEEVNEEQLMLDLVEKYRHAIQSPTGSFDLHNGCVVVLTGVTGFLGTHILDLLLRDNKAAKIVCLVRAQNPEDAHGRVMESLVSRDLRSVDEVFEDDKRIVCLPYDFSAPRLGLADAEWKQLAREATIIIHSAWPVNFSLKLNSFEDQLQGLCHLLELRDTTVNSAARFVFISSIAAVSSADHHDRPILETLSSEPEDASPRGYSRSKWVAENICAMAKVEKSPIIIIRVGQLCGNSQGVWNTTEAYPIMLSSSKITGCLPDLADEALSWLPVDVAAQAVLDLSFQTRETPSGRGARYAKMPVYHVCNTHIEPTWTDMVGWLAKEASIAKIQIVSPQDWLRRLEAALEHRNHPARSLLHVWQSAYSRERAGHGAVFDTKRADDASQTMRTVKPLTKEDLLRMWTWIQSNV